MTKDILFWMTDIKDEYLPDIEMMPGEIKKRFPMRFCLSAGMAGLAAAAGLLIVVLQVGNYKAPVRPPVTLVTEESTEAESTQVSDMKEEIPGLEVNERLVIRTGEDSIAVVDRTGTVTQTFEGARPYSDEGYRDGVMNQMVQVVNENMALPVALCQETDGTYLTGLYSLTKDKWSAEPDKYQRVGNYMYRAGDEFTPGTVLDFDGNWIADVSGTIKGVTGERLIIEERREHLIIGDGAEAREMSGMKPVSTCEEFINWTDQNGAGVVTDTGLNVIVNDEIMTEKNPQLNGTFYGISLVSFDSESGRYLLKAKEAEYGMQIYYLCDTRFSLLESYREESHIVLNQAAELSLSGQIPHYEGEPWMLYEESDSFWMRSVWAEDGKAYELPENVYYSSFNGISRIGDMICIKYAGYGTVGMVYCITEDGNWQFGDSEHQVLGMENYRESLDASCIVRMPDETGGVLEISSKNPDTGMWERHYFLEDGTYLKPERQGELLYAAAEFYCVKDGNRIYVEDYSGNQYAELECEE